MIVIFYMLILVCYIIVAGGLICFTVRPDGVEDFGRKMAELESHGAWALVKEGRLPSYNVEDMPRESSAFAYRVIKN